MKIAFMVLKYAIHVYICLYVYIIFFDLFYGGKIYIHSIKKINIIFMKYVIF